MDYNLSVNMSQPSSNNEKLIEPPAYPEDWECCNNSCEELCVYEIYRVQKQAYDEQQQRLKNMPKTTCDTDKPSQ